MQLLCMSSTDHMVGRLIHNFCPNAKVSLGKTANPETLEATQQMINGEGDTISISKYDKAQYGTS